MGTVSCRDSFRLETVFLYRPEFPVSMFAKVFRQIFDSSLAEDPNVRHMFMDLLVLADPDGVVDMTIGAIAAVTRIPREDAKRWISALELPDADSRTPDLDGRRIVRLDATRAWGWRIVNYRKYRESATREMLRMAEAERKAAWRARNGHGRQRLPLQPPFPTPLSPKKKIQEEEGEPSRIRPDSSRTCPGHEGLFTGRQPTPFDAAQRITLEKELDRIAEEQKAIKGSYDSHQDMSVEDRGRMAQLRCRQREIKQQLGCKF